jgi:AcrR family transcriptional regulator
VSATRRYSSPVRRQQADDTRRRIADAARDLMIENGFDRTTVAEIARASGVAAQTVYAVFGSKRGIMAELMNRARFGPAYQELVRAAKRTTDPAARLRTVAGITRRVYDAERAELGLLQGAAAVAPELAALGQEQEHSRYESQAAVIEALAISEQLRPELSRQDARDILWALTGRDTYRMLVVDRAWPPERYESWLADLLVSALLASS